MPVSSRSARSGTVAVKCSFCGNKFYARPREAVCPKCERPANRPLPMLWRVLSLVVPPLGFVYAALIRPHSPVAAAQGLILSLLGTLFWAAPLLWWRVVS